MALDLQQGQAQRAIQRKEVWFLRDLGSVELPVTSKLKRATGVRRVYLPEREPKAVQ